MTNNPVECIAPTKSLRDRRPSTITTPTCFILGVSAWQKSRLATYLEKSRTRQKHVGAGRRCRWTRNREYRGGRGVASGSPCLSLSSRTHSMARDNSRSPKLANTGDHEGGDWFSGGFAPEIHGTDDDDDAVVACARPRHAIDNSRIFPALNRCHPIWGRGRFR